MKGCLTKLIDAKFVKKGHYLLNNDDTVCIILERTLEATGLSDVKGIIKDFPGFHLVLLDVAEVKIIETLVYKYELQFVV